MPNNHRKRVVVTGAGTVSALGADWPSVSASMRQQHTAVRYMAEWDQYPDLKTRLGAPLDDFQIPDHYRAKRKRTMGRVAQFAVVATEKALENAGLLDDPFLQSGDVGVSYGSSTGSSEAALEFFSLLEGQSMARINTSTYVRMMSHTAAVNISTFFGTQGRMYTTSSACTAGTQGVGNAFEAIREGKQIVMIAGGAEELCPTQAAVFDVVLAASLQNDQPEIASRPFDVARDGLVVGEGATTLILEEYEHARQRGATILAEIIGYATNTDGHHIIRPNQKTMEKVMQLSLQDAGVNADKIAYVSAHATATRHGDIAESHATRNVLGNKPISSLKGYTGHTLGACGAFELWSSIMMMRDGQFAPNLNLKDIDPECAELDYLRDEFRPIDAEYFMSNNFAFGGINASLIVKNV